MNTQKRLAIYEARLARARATVKDALALAGMPASTYYRWKNGTRAAIRPHSLERFERAVDKLAPPATTPKRKSRAKPRPKPARKVRS